MCYSNIHRLLPPRLVSCTYAAASSWATWLRNVCSVSCRCLALCIHHSTPRAIKWFYFKRETSTPLCGGDTIVIGIETVLSWDTHTKMKLIDSHITISPCYKASTCFLLRALFTWTLLIVYILLYKSKRWLDFGFEEMSYIIENLIVLSFLFTLTAPTTICLLFPIEILTN